MAKGISEDAQIHISVAFLIKAMIAVGMAVSSYFQIKNEFADQDRRIKELQDKVTVLAASVEGMEQEHIQELEATVQEQKSLLQKIGLKR
tara:strand:- start:49 stop:318 length:270 start_codon:yes stop_codon:yes gene_type:complete